ncbi:hypothetical protein PV326_001997 [Microctonus aethiopoides]|nr:hypothetical protein PV326_001997 [Microctonus aethiopoides]
MSVHRWKGRYVKKNVKEILLKRSEMAKELAKNKREKQKLKEVENASSYPVKGIRLIDLEYLSESMYCSKCTEKLFVQDIENETITGAASKFHVRCHKCSIHSGLGQTKIDQLFTVMGLPKFNVHIFKDHERIIAPVIELVAKESCEEATALERTITEENVDSLKNLL